MEQNNKLQLLRIMGHIYDQARNCKLERTFFEKIDSDLHFLSQYFKASKNQSFFIAMVFALNYKGNTVDWNDLIEYFDCNPMRILEFSEDFEELYAKQYFHKQKSRHRMNVEGANDQFLINEKLTKAILNNQPLPVLGREGLTNVIDLLNWLYDLGNQRSNEDLITHELLVKTEKIIKDNLHFPLIRKVFEFNMSVDDAYLYLYVIWKTICGHERVDLGIYMEAVYDIPSQRVMHMQKILNRENILFENNLLELVEAGFFNDSELKLTDKSFDLLNECELRLFVSTNKKRDNVIAPESIPERKLIFHEEEMKQLAMLNQLLKDDKLSATQERLLEKNLPKGICVLFHGTAGTGKTESVMQLARETQRDIMKVDISKSKSMWFGESEKIIKRIFTDYQEYSKKCERTPILLFNEADAIFSKRTEVGNSAVGQTQNAVQNIILEEMEQFQGLLIATTNITFNFDKAFERRFLFKVKFQKPGLTAKKEIWKIKLPNLTPAQCEILSSEFDFSGGQIDNVLRKSDIHEIVNGNRVDFDGIVDFCKDELLDSKRGGMGFRRS